VAKNLVAAGLVDRAQLQVAYAIGVAASVSIVVGRYGTGHGPDAALGGVGRRARDLSPVGITQDRYPPPARLKKIAAHRDPGGAATESARERTDGVKDLRDDAGI